MAHHMVRGDIQHHSHMRAEAGGSLHLIAGNLCHYAASLASLHRLLAERDADIAAYPGIFVSGLHQLTQQGNGSSLAVGAGYCQNWGFCQLVCYLYLGNNADIALVCLLHQRHLYRHSRRKDYHVRTIQKACCLRAENQLHTGSPHIGQIVFQILLSLGITQDNLCRPQPLGKLGHGIAADAYAYNQYILICKIHHFCQILPNNINL